MEAGDRREIDATGRGRDAAGATSEGESTHVDLSLTTRQADGKTIVSVGGEIDVYTAPKLRDKISELVASGAYDIVIDMQQVEFLDSTGLGVLVGGLKKVRAHDGSLRLVCNQDRLLKIFRITGLAKVFVIHETADEALAAG
jgi:anti-sigma B factor antagonist